MNLRSTASAILGLLVTAAAASGQVTGFTEPFRVIQLASDESGTIAQLSVVEGAAIKKGQVIAQLDDRVQRLQVELAEHLAASTSALKAAQQTLKNRQAISDRIQKLVKSGHASEAELARAELELAVARANLAAAEEEITTRRIELRQAQAELDRRSIHAPFDGVVAEIHKRTGEYLSQQQPQVVTLIQVDQLLAIFHVPAIDVARFSVGQQCTVSFDDGRQVRATVQTIGVQMDAESGTVPLKVRFANPGGRCRAGEQCYLEYQESPARQ